MRLLICFCTALAFASATAAVANDTPAVLAEADRAVSSPRALQVVIPQTEIETNVDLGRMPSSAMGGGLIGALIISSTTDREKQERLTQALRDKAETAVAPLRAALRGFDVDALAVTTTNAALSKTGWFQAQAVSVSKDPSPQGASAFFGASSAPQVAFVTYRYDLSPDFAYIRVSADIALVRKAPQNGMGSALPKPFYEQHISSIVQLRSRSYENSENAASWSANDGKLAKASLIAAFGQIERLIPVALGLGDADLKQYTAKNRPKGFSAGFYGPLIQRDEAGSDGVLLWTGGLVHVQSTPAG